jgi:hypothetical protein
LFQGVSAAEMKDSCGKRGQDGILSHDQFALFQGVAAQDKRLL